MAITINGTGSITGLTAGGLPDGSVTAADLASSLDLTGKTVTLPSGTGGKILNVWQQVKTDTQTVGSRTFVDISGLSVTLTPQSDSSTFLIMYHLGTVGSVASGPLTTQILRNTTAIGNGTDGTQNGNAVHYLSASNICSPSGGYYLDSPATASQIVYKLQMAGDGATAYLNRRQSDNFFRTASTFTVMEIG